MRTAKTTAPASQAQRTNGRARSGQVAEGRGAAAAGADDPSTAEPPGVEAPAPDPAWKWVEAWEAFRAESQAAVVEAFRRHVGGGGTGAGGAAVAGALGTGGGAGASLVNELEVAEPGKQ